MCISSEQELESNVAPVNRILSDSLIAMRVAGNLSRGRKFIFGKFPKYMVNVARKSVVIPIQCMDLRAVRHIFCE